MKLDKDLYTVEEVADMLGVSRQAVYRWFKQRGLRWVHLGARRRVTREAIQEFLRPGNPSERAEVINV